MSPARCVVFQPLNGIGLGHTSRLAAVAVALGHQFIGIKSIFGLEGTGSALLESLKLPYFSVPTGGAHGSAWAAWSDQDRFLLKRRLVEAAFELLNPSLVVFDLIPSAVFSKVSISQGRKMAICIRPVANANQYWRDHREFLDLVDLVLLPFQPGEWPIPSRLVGKTRYVGQICRLSATRHRQSARSRMRKSLVISGGGGGYPGTVDFYNFVLKAIKYCRNEFPDLITTLVTGPLFRDWALLDTIDGVKIMPFVEDMTSLWSHSSLAIVQAGYNTVAELTTFGIPTICIPAQRKHDDQVQRAFATSDRLKYFRVFTGVTPSELAAEINRGLQTQMNPRRATARQDGARLAAEALSEVIGCS
jgi:predicted glycosyltransferase